MLHYVRQPAANWPVEQVGYRRFSDQFPAAWCSLMQHWSEWWERIRATSWKTKTIRCKMLKKQNNVIILFGFATSCNLCCVILCTKTKLQRNIKCNNLKRVHSALPYSLKQKDMCCVCVFAAVWPLCCILGIRGYEGKTCAPPSRLPLLFSSSLTPTL